MRNKLEERCSARDARGEQCVFTDHGSHIDHSASDDEWAELFRGRDAVVHVLPPKDRK